MATRLLIFATILIARLALATEDAAPPLKPAQLAGVWESILGQTQLYRMELFGTGDGYLAFMVDREATIFRLTSASVSSGGRVYLEFRNLVVGSIPSDRASFDGHGWAVEPEGFISGKLTFRGGGNYAVDILFVKGPNSRTLAKMSQRAEQLIDRARRKPH